MAFNRIGNALARRKTDIEAMRRSTKGAADTVRDFLVELYGNAITDRCTVRYAEDTIRVQVPTKRIASDLLLRAGHLSAVLRAAKFPLKGIVIS